MNKPTKDKVTILLTQEEAYRFYEILCELPYRAATSYDNGPPTEREDSVESVIGQLDTQIHWDD